VITGLSRGSTLFLDDFGILVDGLEGVKAKFNALHGDKAWDALSQSAQKAETVSQAIAEMKQQMGKLGVTGKETVFVFAGIKNQISDAVDRLSLAVAKSGALNKAMTGVRDLFGGIATHFEKGGGFGELLTGKGKSGGLLGIGKALMLDIGESLGRAVGGGLLKAAGEGMKALGGVSEPFMSGLTEKLQPLADGLATVADKADSYLPPLTAAIDGLKKTFDGLKPTFDKIANFGKGVAGTVEGAVEGIGNWWSGTSTDTIPGAVVDPGFEAIKGEIQRSTEKNLGIIREPAYQITPFGGGPGESLLDKIFKMPMFPGAQPWPLDSGSRLIAGGGGLSGSNPALALLQAASMSAMATTTTTPGEELSLGGIRAITIKGPVGAIVAGGGAGGPIGTDVRGASSWPLRKLQGIPGSVSNFGSALTGLGDSMLSGMGFGRTSAALQAFFGEFNQPQPRPGAVAAGAGFQPAAYPFAIGARMSRTRQLSVLNRRISNVMHGGEGVRQAAVRSAGDIIRDLERSGRRVSPQERHEIFGTELKKRQQAILGDEGHPGLLHQRDLLRGEIGASDARQKLNAENVRRRRKGQRALHDMTYDANMAALREGLLRNQRTVSPLRWDIKGWDEFAAGAAADKAVAVGKAAAAGQSAKASTSVAGDSTSILQSIKDGIDGLRADIKALIGGVNKAERQLAGS